MTNSWRDLGILILILNLYLGEVTLRTKKIHQLTGYARIYLGKKGYYLMIIAFVIFSYGALVAYILKIGEFLHAILNPLLGGSIMLYSILFFILAFFIVFEGVRFIEKSETLMVFLMFGALIIITILSIPSLNFSNLTELNLKNFFLPYGVVLFALAALPAIPEINEELRKNKKDLKKIIIIGSLIPIVTYAIFALIVVGVTGVNTSDGSILGLANILGKNILVLGSFFGILTMGTSFIAVAFALREMYTFDYGLNKKNSSFISCIIPLIIVLLIVNFNIQNAFFHVLDITGTFGGSLEGILILLIWKKAKYKGNRKPEYSISDNKFISLLLTVMFILGVIFELVRLFF